VSVIADPATCSVQFDPIGRSRFDESGCDIAKSFLAKAGIPYRSEAGSPGAPARVRIGPGERIVPGPDSIGGATPDEIASFQNDTKAELARVGYPARADPARIDKPLVVLILTILVLYVTMVYGPIAALLVELFPTRIRYTSMSLPYHVGNGWFGGFLPTTAFAMVAATGDIYYGLWYPIVVAVLTVILGLLFLPETYRRPIED
jgi:hypothetical protein